MAEFTWTYDAPTGVYKNHAMSEQIRFAAISETKMLGFCTPESGYGKKRGESITITRVSALTVPTSGTLTENLAIPEDQLTLSTVQITVVEWGRSVPFTSYSDDLGEFSMESIVQRALKDQMKVTLDNAAAVAFKGGQLKYEATGVASYNLDTAGTPTQQAVSNLNMFHIESIRDLLFGTYLTPAYEGDDYIGLVSTKAKRGIMNDPAWEPWHRYTDPEAKYSSEVGRMENIRFIEINNPKALSGAIGLNGVAGEAVFFGADAIAMAVAEDPELRAKIPTDYGRSLGVAWYGILQFGAVWTSANPGEARIIHFTST